MLRTESTAALAADAAEDAAFDALEHAYEEGDRAHFELDLRAWEAAIERKLAYLRRRGVTLPERESRLAV